MAEEHFDTEASDLVIRAQAVKAVVSRGIFTMEEALEIYQLTREEYVKNVEVKPDLPDFLKEGW